MTSYPLLRSVLYRAGLAESPDTTRYAPAFSAACAYGSPLWIDLDNSPHVPFFAPIIRELNSRGFPTLVTARDCFQVTGLLDLMQVEATTIGRHNGKNKFMKLAGLGVRAMQLLPAVRHNRPVLAISHGSRSQLIASALLGIPSITLLDYEHVTGWALIHPTWIMVPEVVPDSFDLSPGHVLRYPGIKEDVYVPRFQPDPSLLGRLGIGTAEIVVTLRPPASEAHYHRPESDTLFKAVVEFLAQAPTVRMIVLPRNQKQAGQIRASWPQLCAAGKLLIPPEVIDGLNLIWYSDLVISGGGTMNREAAALGVPVYSTFRGTIGAVDQYLSDSGRLTLIESVADIPKKIRLTHRLRPDRPSGLSDTTLQTIVNHIVTVAELSNHE